jgi:catechol 2,3-dioxygenase-like lactoylglutathione lyase family enzyme
MPAVQVSFTTFDAEVTAAWYERVFGFVPAGGMRGAAGDDVAAMMGLPAVRCDMQWLVDSSDLFQLEFFQFHEPASVAGSRSPADAGWVLVGLDVEDFDAVLARLAEEGAVVGPVVGAGPSRRVCARDPEGVWLEVRQQAEPSSRAVRPVPVATRFIRAVVRDLSEARAFFCDALGLRATTMTLHTGNDEALWGDQPSRTESCVLSCDGIDDGFLVELVQYLDRVPKPLPDGYRISDQGILNVAFGSRDLDAYAAVTERIRLGGFQINGEVAIGPARGCYVRGVDDLSVELTAIPDPGLEAEFGYLPSDPARSHQW